MNVLRAVLAAMLPLWSISAAGQATIELAAGMYRIEAEVAADFDSRARGLMYRRTLTAQAGMLFVFPDVARHCMWMRNTHLPLSVAFIDSGGRIVNIEDMAPLTEQSHCAAKPARYALEMGAGWFAQRGIGAGISVRGLDKAPLPR